MENLVVNNNFWKNKRVFITGHTGFKGGWLSLWLQNLGATVFGYALEPNTSPNIFELASVSDGMVSYFGDIRDLSKLSEILSECKPDIVIHMAAQPLVRYSYKNPIETFSTNILGVVNMFEAVRCVSSVKVVINVTTDKVYENQQNCLGHRETDALGGYDPYSSSKACSEIVSSSYRNSFFDGKCVATARAGNVIGGGDWGQDRLIPDFVRSVVAQKEIFIRYPKAIRPWQHVLEPLCGYLNLAEKLWHDPDQYADAWNFGPLEQDVKSVDWVVNYLIDHWDRNIVYKKDNSEQPVETDVLKLNVTKSIESLDWYPRWCLEETLDNLIQWYQSWIDNEDMRHVTLSQIKKYELTFGEN